MRSDLETRTAISASPEPHLGERLRELPDVARPPYDYAEFSRRYSRRRARETQRPVRLLAAALAVVVAGWVLKQGLPGLIGTVATVADAPQRPDPPLRVAPVNSGAAESWLQAQPRQAIVRVPTQMAVTELEDQIATLDDQLNAARLSQPQARQLVLLQRDRAQLVESLAQVRYAQNLVAGLP
ncbi:MAG TPA: hypothetical protein VMC02_13710 [Steroidobacteraceae bacterium]|nr:hypothetical protein [Steroidobacteraceae bacterium]